MEASNPITPTLGENADAARLPHGSEWESLLQLAEGYRLLRDETNGLRKVN